MNLDKEVDDKGIANEVEYDSNKLENDKNETEENNELSFVDKLTYVVSVENPGCLVPPNEITTVEPPKGKSLIISPITKVNQKTQEVVFTEEKIVYKNVKAIIEKPVEQVKYVKKLIKKEVVEFIEKKTDEIVEVPTPYFVEEKKYVPSYVDVDQYCCVAQTYIPNIRQGPENKSLCTIYEPQVRVIDVHIPKIVDGSIVCTEGSTAFKRLTEISKAQWNTLVLKLNPHLCEVGDIDYLPVHRGADGTVLAYKADEAVGVPINESVKDL